MGSEMCIRDSLYPLRGEIKDRKEKIIATNIKVFDLYVIPEHTKNLSKTLDDLSNFTNFDFQKKRDIINKKNYKDIEWIRKEIPPFI